MHCPWEQPAKLRWWLRSANLKTLTVIIVDKNLIKEVIIVSESNPYDKAHELARSIKQSQAFQRYLAAKLAVDQHPDYKDKILRVRGKQMELNRAHIMGQQLPADLMSELSQELAALREYAEINEFFDSESYFINLFQDIQNIIQSALDADLKD